ncbi:class C sortase [Anaerococcus provencensis]|uniref:class C sortase n=1 Tax=Anaerococcus provencensis TaxID=938293 RepID=UPI0002D75537|nr:class C sortase [Anaerococcus provencensis]
MNKKGTLKKNLPFILIFIIGLLIFAYPLISQKYYEIESTNEVVEFQKKTDEVDKADIEKRIDLARAYNSTLDPSRLADPFTEKEKEGRAEYARMLEVNEMLGHVEIPRIGQDLPVYAGTSDDVLEKGLGHLEGTSLPIGGTSTHTVITGHRGLPNAKLFRNLDQLVEGDIFYIHNIETTLAYQIDHIEVVDPSNFEPVMVKEGEDLATLLTCTPYMINSHRLLVRGHRIPYQAAIDDGVANTPRLKPDFLQLFLVMLPVIVFLLIILIREARRRKRLSREVESIEQEIKAYKN